MSKRYRDPSALGRTVEVEAKRADGKMIEFAAKVRIDTPNEAEHYGHGGKYVLRRPLKG